MQQISKCFEKSQQNREADVDVIVTPKYV